MGKYYAFRRLADKLDKIRRNPPYYSCMSEGCKDIIRVMEIHNNPYGFSDDGYDRGGYSISYYADKVFEMAAIHNDVINEPVVFSKHFSVLTAKKPLAFILNRIRVGLEIGVHCVILHLKGKEFLDNNNNLNNNIETCRKYKLLSENFIKRLHKVRKICNSYQHSNIGRNDIYVGEDEWRCCIDTFSELINFVDNMAG